MSFDGIIGQEKTKKKLAFFVQAQNKNLISPHLFFVAPKGCGKTLLAKTYASLLINSSGKKRNLIEINCSSLTTLRLFVSGVLDAYVVGKEVTILFDEASEIPRDIRMSLLTMLNPNKENKNQFIFGDNKYIIDFSKVTFLFATTEAHKIFHALTDRLERVDLEEYSSVNLSAIVQKNIDGKVSETALKEIVKVLRGNARQATKMAENINRYLRASDKKDFDVKEWKTFSKIFGIMPLGLSPLEIKVLQILAQKPETTLTNLSAKTHMTRESLQRDLEFHLQRMNLIEVTPTGRRITVQGKQYLADVGE